MGEQCEWTADRLTMYQEAIDNERIRYEGAMVVYRQEVQRHESKSVPSYQAAMERYEAEKVLFDKNMVAAEACTKCSMATGDLQEKSDIHQRSRSAAKDARNKFHELKDKEARAKEDLDQASSHHSALTAESAALEASWLPQVVPCKHTEGNYTAGKKPFVLSCIPTKYGQSCEKACVEAQTANGCAVLEGAQPAASADAAPQLSAIKATCSPPQSSWVFASEGDTSEQCARIEASQQPQYSQVIVKQGMLLKKSRTGEWQKRAFALESGDSVRSAKLRYLDADGQEKDDKSINLWTIKGVTIKSYPEHPRSPCFKVYGTQDYRFCIPDFYGSAERERSEWMKHIKSALG